MTHPYCLANGGLFYSAVRLIGLMQWDVSIVKIFQQKKSASHPLLAWWKSSWWECSPAHKKVRVCAIISKWLGAHKRTCVDHWDTPNHHTSICSYHVCECVNGSTEGDCKRICAIWGLQTCMLPRELILERVAPSHTGMTQLSDWAELYNIL